MMWETVKLGDAATFVNGYAFKPSDWSTHGKEIIRIQNLTRSSSEVNRFDGTIPEKYLVKSGDLLISWSATLGVYEWQGEDSWLNQHIFKVEFNKRKIDKRFFRYLIESKLHELERQVHGATMKHITKGKFDNIPIHLPPLPVQKQIADTLDKADALRKKDQQLLQKYDELAQSIFYEMFGDPVQNARGWKAGSVIDFCECIVPGRDKPKSFSGDIPWVTTDDLKHLGITYRSKKLIGLTRIEVSEVKARLIPRDSVLMTCVGDLGVISIAGNEMVVNQQLHSFQCKEMMNPYFLMFVLSYNKDYMLKMASSTTVPYMNKTVCNSVPVICPPIELQNKFASAYGKLLRQSSVATKGEYQSAFLFDAILNEYFS